MTDHLDTAVQALTDARAALTEQLDGIAAQIDTVERAIAALTGTTPVQERPKAKAPRKGSGGPTATCDECGHTAKSEQGLRVHVSRKHKTPVAAVKAPAPGPAGGPVDLTCQICDTTRPTPAAMEQHIRIAHAQSPAA